jgi:hypothetical protein
MSAKLPAGAFSHLSANTLAAVAKIEPTASAESRRAILVVAVAARAVRATASADPAWRFKHAIKHRPAFG